MKKIIGQFIGSLDSGGAETIVLSIAKELDDSIVICRPNSWIESECLKRNIPCICLTNELEALWNSRSFINYARKFSNFLSENKINLLHSHLYKGVLKNSLACWFQEIPHVGTLHDSYSFDVRKTLRRFGLKICQRLGTQLITVSESVKRIVNLKNVHVVYNGIRLKEPSKSIEEVRKNLGLSKDSFLVISVARLIPLKRIDALIKAMFLLKDKDIKTIIVGTGPKRNYLENLVQGLFLEDQIIFLGQRNDIPSLLAASDVFVLPSESEGLSCSIIEALHSSLPIIATNVGGNFELVSTTNGLLIPLSEDHSLLSNAILEIYQLSENQRNEMKRSSSKIANEKFSLEKMIKEYCFIYETMLYNNSYDPY